MNELSIERINKKSPYKVEPLHGGYTFTTESGIDYSVHFTEEFPLGGCETYQFMFSKLSSGHASFDNNIRQTLIVIIEEFFSQHRSVLLYICDTSDNREASRNRLFARWFKQFAVGTEYVFRSANSIVEGQGFYAAIIVEKNNPNLNAIINDFEESARELAK